MRGRPKNPYTWPLVKAVGSLVLNLLLLAGLVVHATMGDTAWCVALGVLLILERDNRRISERARAATTIIVNRGPR